MYNKRNEHRTTFEIKFHITLHVAYCTETIKVRGSPEEKITKR